jgi:hypothetical protein
LQITSWALSELLEAFERLLTQETMRMKLCLFIDGLDEYDDIDADIPRAKNGIYRIVSRKDKNKDPPGRPLGLQESSKPAEGFLSGIGVICRTLRLPFAFSNYITVSCIFADSIFLATSTKMNMAYFALFCISYFTVLGLDLGIDLDIDLYGTYLWLI